jgi:hypothetical protein
MRRVGGYPESLAAVGLVIGDLPDRSKIVCHAGGNVKKVRLARLARGRLVCPATDSGYNLLVALEEDHATQELSH